MLYFIGIVMFIGIAIMEVRGTRMYVYIIRDYIIIILQQVGFIEA